VARWHSGKDIGLSTPKVAGSTPGLADTSGSNLGEVVHTRAPRFLNILLGSSIIWYRSMGGDALRLGR